MLVWTGSNIYPILITGPNPHSKLCLWLLCSLRKMSSSSNLVHMHQHKFLVLLLQLRVWILKLGSFPTKLGWLGLPWLWHNRHHHHRHHLLLLLHRHLGHQMCLSTGELRIAAIDSSANAWSSFTWARQFVRLSNNLLSQLEACGELWCVVDAIWATQMILSMCGALGGQLQSSSRKLYKILCWEVVEAKCGKNHGKCWELIRVWDTTWSRKNMG